MRDSTLRMELRAYLDTLTIRSENIGDIRRSLLLPWDSMWNGWVRDETAARENRVVAPPPPPEAAGTAREDVCPECGRSNAECEKWPCYFTGGAALAHLDQAAPPIPSDAAREAVGNSRHVSAIPDTRASDAARLIADADGMKAEFRRGWDAGVLFAEAQLERQSDAARLALGELVIVTCHCGKEMEPVLGHDSELLYMCDDCKPGQVNVRLRASASAAPEPTGEER